MRWDCFLDQSDSSVGRRGGLRRSRTPTSPFRSQPETGEQPWFLIKPVPLAWFYDERFVNFLEEFLWQVPRDRGLTPSIAHGGAQFSLSAKTFMVGSLLADDIAYKLNHPWDQIMRYSEGNLNRLQIAGELRPPGSTPGRCRNGRPAPRRRGVAGPPASGGPAAQPGGCLQLIQPS